MTRRLTITIDDEYHEKLQRLVAINKAQNKKEGRPTTVWTVADEAAYQMRVGIDCDANLDT